MKFLERLYHASIFVPQRVKAIKVEQANHALSDAIVLFVLIITVGFSWNISMTIEGFVRVSGEAGLSELLYFIRQLVILDLIPLTAIIIALRVASGLPGMGKNIELGVAVWTQPPLIRLVMGGIPLVVPQLNYYPIPYVEVPQLVAYMWGLLSLSCALSCCKTEKKNPQKGGGWLFQRKLSYAWVGVLVLGALLLYWVPLFRAVPIFIKAPTFVLPSTDGKTCDLSAQKGKIVLLEFWSTRCPHCRKQAKEMHDIADTMDPAKVTIFAVHTRGGKRAERNVKELMDHKNIHNCFDDGTIAREYTELSPYHRLRGVPHTMIIDRHGIIRKVLRGRKDAAIIMSHMKRYLAR